MRGLVFSGLLSDSCWLSPAYVALDKEGSIQSISSEPKGELRYEAINGYALPGMPNAHSHAFQYAMAGICENKSVGKNTSNFWSWREKMYEIALSINPDQLENIAAQLYAEMIRHGITHVSEFHYLHNDPCGTQYDNPAEMGERLVKAAQIAGIRITLIPILYQQGGFGKAALKEQRRFITKDLEAFDKLIDASSRACSTYEYARMGVGIHSLRAVSAPSFLECYSVFKKQFPFHLHIAEQTKEVEACLQFYGQRPVEWILENIEVSEQCHLVHATHMTTQETKDLAASGAHVVLCPSTEANLGDGFFNFSEYQNAGGNWSIGTDSHIGINPLEELKLLDYGQRLKEKKRSIFQTEHDGALHRALKNMVASGKRAGGIGQSEFFGIGQPMDALIVSEDHPLIQVTSEEKLLDTLLYTSDPSLYLGTMISGKWIVKNNHHIEHELISDTFVSAIRSLKIR